MVCYRSNAFIVFVGCFPCTIFHHILPVFPVEKSYKGNTPHLCICGDNSYYVNAGWRCVGGFVYFFNNKTTADGKA
jgi:hypothetical protein